MTRKFGNGNCLVCLVLLLSGPAMAAKTDVVVLKNGDRITGEVKSLDRGRLKYSTDSMGTIYIEWDDIDTLVSKEFHRVRVRGGRLYFGTLSDAGGADTVVVEGTRGMPAQPLNDIVRITPLEDSWKERIDLTNL